MFYNKILISLKIKKVLTNNRYIGYARSTTLEKIELYIIKPHNKKKQQLEMVQWLLLLLNLKI